MNEKQILDMMHIVSSCLQAFVIILALMAFSHVDNKRAWWWFVLASLFVFTRRLTASVEALLNVNTDMLEAIQTVSISIMWILFIIIRTDKFKYKGRNSNGS